MTELELNERTEIKNQDRLDALLSRLNKCANLLDPDKAQLIIFLEKEFNIRITKEKLPIQYQYIWIMVLRPFTIKVYNLVKKQLDLRNFPHLINSYVIKCQLDGKDFIKYPEKIEISIIQHKILDDLTRTRIGGKLTETEWEVIMSTASWKMAESQVARELIALNIYNEMNNNPMEEIKIKHIKYWLGLAEIIKWYKTTDPCHYLKNRTVDSLYNLLEKAKNSSDKMIPLFTIISRIKKNIEKEWKRNKDPNPSVNFSLISKLIDNLENLKEKLERNNINA
ncbi:MAG: hypothetical protein EU529_11500 [Promethearchaeota archaeon]|nr:MAG: hypothetical protein EU529_11500 [Candidatus Lokiarchaeota archaeon]